MVQWSLFSYPLTWRQDIARVLALYKLVINSVRLLNNMPVDMEVIYPFHLFGQFANLEHAKAAQGLNGKLEIAGRNIKVAIMIPLACFYLLMITLLVPV